MDVSSRKDGHYHRYKIPKLILTSRKGESQFWPTTRTSGYSKPIGLRQRPIVEASGGSSELHTRCRFSKPGTRWLWRHPYWNGLSQNPSTHLEPFRRVDSQNSVDLQVTFVASEVASTTRSNRMKYIMLVFFQSLTKLDVTIEYL